MRDVTIALFTVLLFALVGWSPSASAGDEAKTSEWLGPKPPFSPPPVLARSQHGKLHLSGALPCSRGPKDAHWTTLSADGRALAYSRFYLFLRERVEVVDAVTQLPLRFIYDVPPDLCALALSPHGEHVALGFESGNIRIFSVESTQLLWEKKSHEGPVNVIVFGPKGQRICSGGQAGGLKVWDVKAQSLVHELKGHKRAVRRVRWLEGGARLASLAEGEASLFVWDSKTGRKARTVEMGRPLSDVAVSPTTGAIAATFEDGRALVWNKPTEYPIALKSVAKGGAWLVEFAPDGRHVLVSGVERSLEVYDSKTARLVSTVKMGALFDLRVGGDLVLTYDERARLNIWRFEAIPQVRLVRVSGAAPIMTMLVDPGGSWIALEGRRGHVVFYDLKDGHELSSIQVGGAVSSLDAHVATGRLLVSGYGGPTRIWKIKDGVVEHTLGSKRECGRVVRFAPGGEHVAIAGDKRRLRIESLAGGVRPLRLLVPRGLVCALAYSPDGKTLISAGSDMVLHARDTATGRELWTLSGHGDRPTHLAWVGLDLLASAAGDGTIRLWDLKKRQQAKGVLVRHPGEQWPWMFRVSSMAVSRNRRWLAAGGSDRKLRVWSLPDLALLDTIELRGRPDSLAFQGEHLWVGFKEGRVSRYTLRLP